MGGDLCFPVMERLGLWRPGGGIDSGDSGAVGAASMKSGIMAARLSNLLVPPLRGGKSAAGALNPKFKGLL